MFLAVKRGEKHFIVGWPSTTVNNVLGQPTMKTYLIVEEKEGEEGAKMPYGFGHV